MATTFDHTLATTVIPNPPSHTVTLADADFQTLVNYLVVKYTPRRGGAAPTPQQAITLWLQEAYSRILGEVQQWQVQQQQQAINVPIIPVTIT